VLQALFDPFDLNDDATGITIGLYLARALTVAHGGTVGVEQDDHGGVLWVRIPAARRDAPAGDDYPSEGE
jgi:signal transduction histidine kinase